MKSSVRPNASKTVLFPACAAVVLAGASVSSANSGTQLPLSQFQAGSETTQNSVITNAGFEQPGAPGPNATGWTNSGAMSVGAPDPAHLPTPASAIGSFSAKAANNDIFLNETYTQTITLQPNTDYAISAYMWNFALAHPDGNPINFFAGDLVVLQMRDPGNFFNTAGVILERQTFNDSSVATATGQDGAFVYKTFNSSQFSTNQVTLEVLSDPNEDLSGGRPSIMGQWDNIAITPVTQFVAQKWNATGGGTWGNSASWMNGQANWPSAVASFLGAISAPSTITLDAPKSVAVINFDSTNSYTIDGTSILTIGHEEDRDAALLNVLSGQHTISAPITVTEPSANGLTNFGPRLVKVTVTPANGKLTLSNNITGSGTAAFNVTKNGAGQLDMKNVRVSRLTVNAGTVGVLAGGTDASVSNVSSLTLAAGATLDLNDNDLVLKNGTRAAIEASVAGARNGGAWDGTGITSSSARTQPQSATTLGVLDGSEYLSINGPSFGGFTVAPTDVLVKYTWYGDTDFNGVVDFDDYVRTDGGFNGGLTGWQNGDFDLSGSVDFDDYVLIDLGFNTQTGTLRRAQEYIDGTDRSLTGMDSPALEKVIEHFAQFGTDYGTHFLAAVPEPGMLSLVAIAGALLVRRR